MIKRAKSGSWSNEDITKLVKAHAEGKPNCEIYGLFPNRSSRAVDAKMLSIGLDRNLTPARKTMRLKYEPPENRPVPDPWCINVRFENITRDEAKRVSAGAPNSARYPRYRITPHTYGNIWPELVA